MKLINLALLRKVMKDKQVPANDLKPVYLFLVGCEFDIVKSLRSGEGNSQDMTAHHDRAKKYLQRVFGTANPVSGPPRLEPPRTPQKRGMSSAFHTTSTPKVQERGYSREYLRDSQRTPPPPRSPPMPRSADRCDFGPSSTSTYRPSQSQIQGYWRSSPPSRRPSCRHRGSPPSPIYSRDHWRETSTYRPRRRFGGYGEDDYGRRTRPRHSYDCD
jgi:hypothetical protein